MIFGLDEVEDGEGVEEGAEEEVEWVVEEEQEAKSRINERRFDAEEEEDMVESD